jgi:hypothetical protein
MSFLVDTNVISELRKGARAHTRVRDWFRSVDDDALYLSVLVIGELRQGIERLRRRDPAAAASLDRWLHDLSGATPTGRCGRHRRGRPVGPDQRPGFDPDGRRPAGGDRAGALVDAGHPQYSRRRRTGVRHLDPFC